MNPDDVVVLMADLQPPLLAGCRTNPPALLSAGAAALAQAAHLLSVPILFSVVPEEDGPATHLPVLAPFARSDNTFTRRCASPFGDPAFVTALTATGRRTLVVAGYSTEAVTLFASLDALAAGYTVLVALDAGGARSDRTEAAALRQIERAGGRHCDRGDRRGHVLRARLRHFAGARDLRHRPSDDEGRGLKTPGGATRHGTREGASA